MSKKFKRGLSLILSVIMLISIIPASGLLSLRAYAAAVFNPTWPVDASIRINCGWYGYANHRGIDMAAPTGNSIYAAESGYITIHNNGCKGSHYTGSVKCSNGRSCRALSLGDFGGWANYAEIKHNDTFKTLYAHMISFCVDDGEYVQKGQKIGEMGQCGYTTGPHLHFEVYKNGTRVNPEIYLTSDKRVNDFHFDYPTTSKPINTSNSKIVAKDVYVPENIEPVGNKYDFSGTISSNNGFVLATAAIYDMNGNIIQKGLKNYVEYGPVTPFTLPKSLNAHTVFSKMFDFTKLSKGTYRLKMRVICANGPSIKDQLDITKTVDTGLEIYNGTFTVGAKSAAKVKAKAATASVNRDKYGNTYKVINRTFNDDTTSYSGSSSSNSYYNSNSSYPIGSYKVTASSGLNTRKSPSANSQRLSGLSKGTVVNVTATDANWGYTKYGWICLDYTEYVSGVSTSYKYEVYYETGNYKVDYPIGLNVRKGPGTNYAYKTEIPNGTEFPVTETSGAWGYSPKYDGWLCLNLAYYVSELVPELPVPGTPVVETDSSSEIGVGEVITFNWNAVDAAETYTAKLINQKTGETVQTLEGLKSTSASFTTPSAGTFDVRVTGVNSQHTGLAGGVYGITAKAPSTVTFKDWDGTVISKQTVAYGKSAVLPPQPTRTGYTFNKWNGLLNAIREDLTVTAQYTRNSYTVTFVDHDGKVLDTQSVLYEDAAIEPSYSAPSGYSFVKWDKDFGKITENTVVTAVVSWTSIYPLEISTTSTVVRNNKTYVTTAIVNNSPNAISNAKVIMALKTAEDKQLQYVESSNFSMAKGEKKTINLSADYDGASTVANIFVVKDNDEKIPLSNMLRVSVDQGTAWSQWSTSTPPANALKTESRTEYRYRDKEYATSSSSSLSGYTLRTDITNPTITYGEWGTWSSWQDQKVDKSDTVDVKTQSVDNLNSPIYETRYNYKTVYHYYRYSTAEFGYNGSNIATSAYGTNRYTWTNESYGRFVYRDTISLNGLTAVRYYYYHNDAGNYVTVYADTPYETQEVASSYKVVVGYNKKTQYSYRTRSKTTTYNFEKWGTWKDWSTSLISSSSTRQVETRKTYRYISNTPSNIEDVSGNIRTISGNAGSVFSGRHAILFIKSIDGTTQYIGQTKIASDGNYSFTFKLKNDPTAESGDYIVTLSIEGTSNAIGLSPILAPVPEYTVKFLDRDGNVINQQTLKKGESATAPQPYNYEGYTFTNWDKSFVNVQSDLTVKAQYEENVYDVAFVNDFDGTVQHYSYTYNQILQFPEAPEFEAYNFIGWSTESGTKVIDNLVINAQYERKTFDVTFLDYEGNVFKTEKVEYGEAVLEPTLENTSNCIFIAWNYDGDLNYITQNMIVEPYFEYTESVKAPVASIQTGSYTSEQTVKIECETPGAQIYYTTDGSYPLDTPDASLGSMAKAKSISKYSGTLYTGPFTMDSSANLIFVAVKDGMNPSDIEEKICVINTGVDLTKYLVNIHYEKYDFVDTQIVESGSYLPLSEESLQEPGYTFVGAFKDAAYTTKWNLLSDKVTSDVDIYLKWDKNSYTVSFADINGNIIDTQTVLCGDEATAPMWEEIPGYIFAGWDRSYSNIYEDMVIKATYIPESELTSITLNKHEITMTEGETTTLDVAVKLGKDTINDQVIWQSSDVDIVAVDDNGKLHALSNGTATVYTISEDSGISDSCEVTVNYADPCAHGNHQYIANVISASCVEPGYTTYVCKLCNETYVDNLIEPVGHSDSNKDRLCDICGIFLEEHNPSGNCSHICHKSGFSGFIWKIFNIFNRLFRINKTCDCGVTHY